MGASWLGGLSDHCDGVVCDRVFEYRSIPLLRSLWFSGSIAGLKLGQVENETVADTSYFT